MAEPFHGHLERAFLHFDFETSLIPGRPPVADRPRERFPADLSLLRGGVLTGSALGVAGGRWRRCVRAASSSGRPRRSPSSPAIDLVVDVLRLALDPVLRGAGHHATAR